MLHNLSDDPLIFLSSAPLLFKDCGSSSRSVIEGAKKTTILPVKATIIAKHETNMIILSINLLIPKLSCIIMQASNQSNGNGFLISDFNNFSMFSRASRLFSNALFVSLKSGKIRDEESWSSQLVSG